MFHVAMHTKDERDSAWSATPSNSLVQRLHTHFPQGSMRWVAVLRVSGEEHRIALGSPEDGDELSLHLPSWYVDSIGIFGHGEELIVSFEKSERMTRATSLRFRTVDPIPEWLSIRDVLEEPLSQLGVLRQGQILPIPVLESSVIIVEVCEPTDAAFVFLDGEDVAMEVEGLEEPAMIPTARAEPVDLASPFEPADFRSMLASTSGMQEQEQEQEQEPVVTPRAFVPFSGKGHVLGTGRVVWGP